jgi:hypothetical protein
VAGSHSTTINNQNDVLKLFLKITGVGAASCRETVFAFPQRRIRLKDGRFKVSYMYIPPVTCTT